MNLKLLNKLLKNEPSYRLKQAKKAIFKDLINNWDTATTLPINLREILNKEFPLSINGEILISKNKKTSKAIIILKDGQKIESVLMKHKDGRNTVCVSSQVGCPLGCIFCATGKLKFKRNLEIPEIIEQVLFFARFLRGAAPKGGSPLRVCPRVTNIVFMGMGEPFLNYENVLGAIKILNDKEYFNIGARRISISTVGIIEGIKKLAKEKLEVNLAISLHAPDDNLRQNIMPINKEYNINNVLSEVDNYIKKTKRRVMFEYLMIKDINDSVEHAKKLANLIRKPLYFVNLITYNPTGIFSPSPPKRIQKFVNVLRKEKNSVTQRYHFGSDIDAACGQLVYKDR